MAGRPDPSRPAGRPGAFFNAGQTPDNHKAQQKHDAPNMVNPPGSFKSPGPPDSRRARPQAGPRAGPTHFLMQGTNQIHDAPPPDRARTATYTPNNRPPDAFLNAKHPPPATCTLNIRCTNSTTGQPAGQPDTLTLPTPQNDTQSTSKT